METQLETATFNYEEIDPETRISLKQRAGRIGERTRRMATDIWENGREFAEAQQELASYGNGRFLAWVEAETGYSKSTVYRMIDVHQRLDFPKLGKTDIAASALYLLASASTPEAAREEVMSAAEQGETISHGRAKEIVEGHKHWGLSNGMAFWREVEKLRIDKSRVMEFLQPGATHLTDLEMTKREAFDRLVHAPTEPVAPPQTAVTIPKMWEEWDTAVPAPAAPSPFYVGPQAQNPAVREALGRYLDQWPANRNFIIKCLANRESSRYNEAMAQAQAALGASEMTIHHQARVLENNIPAPSWERDETAVSRPPLNLRIWEIERCVADWMGSENPGQAGFSNPLDALQNVKQRVVGWRVIFDSIKAEIGSVEGRRCADGDLRQAINNIIDQERVLNSEQTAVSIPTMSAIMADVDAYEADTAQLFAATPAPRRADYTDPRLAALNDAINIVTRLTADTSLTIDTVGPLARALGLMEDAKKALANRQAYAAWLRDYQDDDGRRWTDLSDNQTWHKNSPCYQAFVKAFPKEDFARSALMDAKQRLERETAVPVEVTS